ncbi:flagellar basal body P-ring formation chaperone FlgA [Megalodesulfovibrio gigas]|uniref:Putative FlgA family protein n=1 Tax=Megalodesulfovibrio gigas (strain ATCC 19364 / DSM 1382 / NCIMB 9332 / VKM B-1759) TaxID=1121448 RepID=T2G753_MEGG1|nr:flagellar basal body P-ring formation chaperone FlgA [Megalodesulfovibrio gigas]AGW12430.1 putative FlgA family protein [Megalodesulfovibrio gigas DSM 1382 = ATCC 19364]
MRSSICIFILMLVLGLCAVGASQPVGGDTWRVVIKDAAVVEGEVVTLGDIGKPIGLVDQEIWRQLAVTPLFQSPSERGKPMFVQPDAIRQAVAKNLGAAASMVLVNKRLVLQRGGHVLDQETLKDVVVRTLTDFCAAMNTDVEFRELKGPEFIFVEDSSHRLDIQPSQATCQPGRIGFRIQEMTLDGRVAKGYTGSVFLDVWQEMVVAARPLSKGEPITADMLTAARKNASYAKTELWDANLQAGPWRLARSVGQGQPLTRGDVEPLPAVAKGAAVEMLFQGRYVTLRVPALAMGDGAVGDRILVKNTQSNRDVFATVRDARTVTVQ